MARPSAAKPNASPPTSTAAASALVRIGSGEQIATHIRWMIFDGRLRPGMRVPQDQVAAELGVSRIPVREALIVLEREGWVTNELHRGAFINALDEQAVHDHYDLYGLIYGFAAGLALARTGPELADELAVIHRAFTRATEPGDWQRLSMAFHGSIVAGADSPKIRVVLRAISALVPGNFFAAVPDAVAVEKRGLGAIARAMRRGQGDRASAEYARMMRQVGDQVVALFEVRSLFGAPADRP